MQFDTKIAVVIRTDLEAWQKFIVSDLSRRRGEVKNTSPLQAILQNDRKTASIHADPGVIENPSFKRDQP